jgi:hypothetical protein
MEPASRYATTPEIVSVSDLRQATRSISSSPRWASTTTLVEIVLEGLPPQFTAEDLKQGIDNLRRRGIAPA